MKKLALAGLLLALGTSEVLAQNPPRIEDHFWRRKVVNRIDLTEKINAPLTRRENPFYLDKSQFSEKEGLVMALFHGLKEGKYVAYHPDSLTKPMSYEDVLKRVQELDLALTGESSLDEAESELGDGAGFDETKGEGGFDSFAGEDDWGFGTDEAPAADTNDDLATPGAPKPPVGGANNGADFDPAPYESVIQFVEDRIFDKTRSDMVYDIQFVGLIWTDPGEVLPEKPLCVFAYKDITETLQNVQWKNRFNDAEYKNMKEVFELRLFHSFVTNISGEGMRTLNESEWHRQKLVEFEHHLWSY